MLTSQASTEDVKRESMSTIPVTQRADYKIATVGVEPGHIGPRRRRVPDVAAQFCRDFHGQAAESSSGQGSGSSPPTVPPNRTKAQRNWELHEIKVLIAAKRLEWKTRRNGLANFGSRKTKWTAIADYVRDHGVINPIRDSNMCKKKWDKLSANWKKVFDYERDISSGRASYHDMTTHERRELALPMQFNHELYEEIKEWYAGQEVDSTDVNVMYSGNLIVPEKLAAHADGAPEHVKEEEAEGVALDEDVVNHVSNLRTTGSSARSPDATPNVDPFPSISKGRKRKSRSKSEDGSGMSERKKPSNNETLTDVIARGIDSSAKSLRLIAEAGNNCATQMGRIADALLQILAYQTRDDR